MSAALKPTQIAAIPMGANGRIAPKHAAIADRISPIPSRITGAIDH